MSLRTCIQQVFGSYLATAYALSLYQRLIWTPVPSVGRWSLHRTGSAECTSLTVDEIPLDEVRYVQ